MAANFAVPVLPEDAKMRHTAESFGYLTPIGLFLVEARIALHAASRLTQRTPCFMLAASGSKQMSMRSAGNAISDVAAPMRASASATTRGVNSSGPEIAK